MPSLWRVTLSGVRPEHITFGGVHNMVCMLLERPPGTAASPSLPDEEHDVPFKGYSCTLPFATKAGTCIDIGLLKDVLVAPLQDRGFPGQEITFGHRNAKVVSLDCVENHTWPSIWQQCPQRAWGLEFFSPTAKRVGNGMFSPWIDPVTILRGVAIKVNKYAPVPLQGVDQELGKLIAVTDLSLTSEVFQLREKVVGAGAMGGMRWQIIKPEKAAEVHRLIQLLPYTGAGVYTNWGLGTVRLASTHQSRS